MDCDLKTNKQFLKLAAYLFFVLIYKWHISVAITHINRCICIYIYTHII